jgi:hypothetical protein
MLYTYGDMNLDPSYIRIEQCCNHCARCVDTSYSSDGCELICNYDDSKVPPDPSDYAFPDTPEGEQAWDDTWEAWSHWAYPRYVVPWGVCNKFKPKLPTLLCGKHSTYKDVD